MWLAPFLVAAVLFILFSFLYYDTIKPENYPPGPGWLPGVGNVWRVARLRRRLGFTHLVWARLAADHGPVTGLRLGAERVVILSGHSPVKQASARDDFDARPDGFFFRLRSFGERLGIAFVDGPFYQEQKKFILKHLKEFGFGGSSMEQRISEEAAHLIAWLKSQNDRPISMQHAFDVSVLNSLWIVLAGSRFSLDDARLRHLLFLLRESFRLLDMSGGLLNQIPFIRFIAPQWSGYRQTVHVISSINAFLEETVEEHKKLLKPGIINDFTDAFLQETIKRNGKCQQSFTDKQLLMILMDMFMAGSETTSNTMAFAIMFLLQHPRIQEIAYQEIISNVDDQRLPSLKDRQKLPYVEAIILETQRLGNVAPVTPPHRAKRDTTLEGFNIPKDTTVMISLYSVHMDKTYWGDPEVFRPERFLDDKGKIIQHDYFVPFGLGRRRCLGESLAKSSLFLLLSSLIHQFKFTLPPGETLPELKYIDGATLSPPHFTSVLTPRSESTKCTSKQLNTNI